MQHLFAEYTAPRDGGKEPISLDAEHRRRRPRRPVPGELMGEVMPTCRYCGTPIADDEGGLYNLNDLRLVRECRDHYCPF